MANYLDYTDALDELAAKAYSGDYGDTPFDSTTPGGEALLRDAFHEVGIHDLDSWINGSNDGGSIMESIQARFNGHIIDNDAPDSISAAFNVEEREQATIEYAPAAKTMDDVVLEADDKQQQVDLLASRNDAKMERGEPITTLSSETLEALKANGVDVSALEKQFGVAEDASGVDKHEPKTDTPAEVAEGATDKENAVGDPVSSPVEGERKIVTEAPNDTETTAAGVEADEKLTVEDLVFEDEDGNQVSFKDILADLCENDDDINAILSKAVEIADRGEDPRPFMEGAIADYEAKHSAGADIESDANNGVANEAQSGSGDSATNDSSDSSEAKSTYETKFEEHSEKIDQRKALPAQLRGDTFTAYHEMAKVYNAHKGGIEINGKVPTKLDVAVSVLNFTRSNILETLVIELVRSMITKKEDDKDNVDTPEQDKVAPPTDKYGIEESGNIDRGVSPEEAKEIGNYRSVLPEAGKMFGADMTKVDRGSTPDITVRSTNPDGASGRGIAVTLDDAKKYTFPDVRLVDIKGERLLVDPFGKIMEVVSPGDKYKAGQVLSGLDVSSRGMGKEAIETYARDHGLSIDQAKEEISHATKERFCERIESSYKIEASTIERMVLPRELEMKADLQSKLANLENIEKGVTSPEEKAEIGQMKADVSKAIETIDSRIDALRSRQADLEHSGAKPAARSTNERFADAVSSEKKAIGRSVFTTDLGVDRGKVQERVSAGVEAIKARVEAHNATVPEKDRISYDSKTGDFVDRYGISDKGEYVGNKNGNFMDDPTSGPATKDDVAKYLEEHMDPSRFTDTDKILANAEIERVLPDTERQENADVETERDPEAEGDKPKEVETERDPEAEGDKPKEVETERDPEAEGDKPKKVEAERDPEAEGDKPKEVETEQAENTDTEQTENANIEQGENLDAQQTENTDTEQPENTDTERQEESADDLDEVNASENDGTDKTSVDEDDSSDEGQKDKTDADDANEDTSREETSDLDESQNSGVDGEDAENSNVDESGQDVVGQASDNSDVIDPEDDVDDLDDVETAENDNTSSGEEDADVQKVSVSNAIEGREGATSDDDEEDPTQATDGNVEADATEEDEDKNNWLDDLKESLSDYIEGCAKQFTDPIGYEADKIDKDIDQICDLIEFLGGDASGLREAAHELVSSAVDAITNAGDPTAQEAMKEAFSHLFEELGFNLKDPGEFFDPLITECNDAIGTDHEGLVDDLTDAYRDGANDAEEAFNNADTDFDSVHLDDDTLVTNDGVVDELGQTTGGVTDETAPEIETEINDATAENVPHEVEQLDPDTVDPATVEPIEPDVVETEPIDPPDADMGSMEDLPDVDIAETGADAAAEEIAAGAEEEIIEIVAALL